MDFVYFNLAKKLKDLGFDEPFFFFYREDDKDKYVHHAIIHKPLIYCDKIDDEVIIAPTIPQVLKWLRKEKKIYVTVNVEREDWFEYKIVQLIKNTHYTSNRVYETYDDAMLAGIEDAIDNLI